MVEIWYDDDGVLYEEPVSVLNREPMWLKWKKGNRDERPKDVSVLNREPMWLKSLRCSMRTGSSSKFQCSTVSRCG